MFGHSLLRPRCLWNNFGRNPLQTRVFPALVSLFILSDNFFLTLDLFLNKLDFQILNFMMSSLKKKNDNNKNKKLEYSRSLSDPENYWCAHQQPYNFFPISGHFRITEENQNQLIRSEKIAATRGRKFISLSTGGPVYVYSTILVIMKIFIFYLFYFTSALLLIMRSQPASIAKTVTSTAAFYHC